MIGDPQPARPPARRGILVLAWALGIVAAIVAVVLVAAWFVRLPYVVVGPGPVTALDSEVLRIEGAPTYEHDGEVLFLTVNLTRERPNVYRLVQGLLDGSVDVEREEDFFGEEPSRDHLALSVRHMEQSQIAARAVALDTLGYDIAVTSLGGLVQAIAPDGTARGALRLGDVIVAVDGVETTSAEEVGELIRSKEPGDEVVMTVDRLEGRDDASIEDVTVPVGEREGTSAVGILLGDYVEPPEFPVEIALDTREVTGSSAGLAFTLAIIDSLSPGDLTGGQKVAVTGSISIDGVVGRVGGIKHKAEGAKRAGAALLLVPADELEEAERHAGSLPVVGVETIDDALTALTEIGGVVPERDPALAAA